MFHLNFPCEINEFKSIKMVYIAHMRKHIMIGPSFLYFHFYVRVQESEEVKQNICTIFRWSNPVSDLFLTFKSNTGQT